MEKKVIDWLNHEHPLILAENVSKDETSNCYGCGNPVTDLEVVYVCTVQNCSNRIILHKRCGELPSQILHPKHPQHPLHLFDYHKLFGLWCDNCLRDIESALGYKCSSCNFDYDVTCGKISIDMILAENRQIEHPSHPDHPLTLMRKPSFLFCCDGCGVEDVDMAQHDEDDGSDAIEFPLHAHDISKELITPFVMREKGLINIPDVADMPATVKMAVTKARFCCVSWVQLFCTCSGISVMEKKVIDWLNHEHPLILAENVSKDETSNCYGCGNPVTDLEVAYVCTVQNCSNRIILHKKCGELPIQILHPKHPQHPLHLVDYHQGSELRWCDVCLHDLKPVLGYTCFSCDFDVDLKCERISIDMILEENRQIEHPSHPDHPLTLMRKPSFLFCCDGCGVEDVDMAQHDEDDGSDAIEFPLHAHDISKELITPFVMREKGLINIPDVADMPATVKMAVTKARNA
ncbi:hypothetical protein SASPL_139419 [Salvia splendens]|uniref:DC1 domain-containing protein n=1 Tax=Salvia splendens TaxID=180675 RepID=A0A8X8WNZ7_SALSN|nr:hypothetical protein SASPL_139419 [Salvia splendens]